MAFGGKRPVSCPTLRTSSGFLERMSDAHCGEPIFSEDDPKESGSDCD